VHQLTASYSKLADRIYVAQIAQLADLDWRDSSYKTTKAALRRLHQIGAIDWQPSRRHGERSLVTLPIELAVVEAA
jgi:hypothetical protein